MRVRFLLVLLAVSAAAFVGALAVTRALSQRQPAPTSVGAARTSLPGLTPATGEPTLASLETLHPAPRTVAQAPGPFDDRFELHGLSFDGTKVSGSAKVTSDVSDLLELEVLAGFYDSQGRLLGTARHVHHLDEGSADAHDATGPPSESEPFTIAVPRQFRGTAVSAAVGVPVLVNE